MIDGVFRLQARLLRSRHESDLNAAPRRLLAGSPITAPVLLVPSVEGRGDAVASRVVAGDRRCEG
jgi:hypothetical protein